jgi:hypothetical protein
MKPTAKSHLRVFWIDFLPGLIAISAPSPGVNLGVSER